MFVSTPISFLCFILLYLSLIYSSLFLIIHLIEVSSSLSKTIILSILLIKAVLKYPFKLEITLLSVFLLKPIPFSNPEIKTYLPSYKSVYNTYKEVVQRLDSNMYVKETVE